MNKYLLFESLEMLQYHKQILYEDYTYLSLPNQDLAIWFSQRT
jgi:hypothetical protein